MGEERISDDMATWKFVDVTGQIGGIAGNQLRVKISAAFAPWGESEWQHRCGIVLREVQSRANTGEGRDYGHPVLIRVRGIGSFLNNLRSRFFHHSSV
jgi:hypothetical protein